MAGISERSMVPSRLPAGEAASGPCGIVVGNDFRLDTAPGFREDDAARRSLPFPAPAGTARLPKGGFCVSGATPHQPAWLPDRESPSSPPAARGHGGFFVARPLDDITYISHIAAMASETKFPVKKLVTLTEEQARRISDYRFEQRLSSENEAVRRLLELGLAAAAKTKGPQSKSR